MAAKKPALKNVATIARPNSMGVVRNKVLYLLEGKVSADYLEAFPDCTVARLVAYDLTDPAKPVRKGSVDVRAAWWLAAATVEGGASALYVAQARMIEGAAEERAWMDIAVIDVSSPLEPKLAATIPTEQEWVSDSKEPILVVSGAHLLFSSRADASLVVFDISKPTAPKALTRVKLPSTVQAGFGDAEGALLTRLGNDEPMLDVRGAAAEWTISEVSALSGSARRVRARGCIYGPTAKGVGNHLGWYDADAALLGENKLGPTSISVHTDGDVLVTTGDHLSIWKLEKSGEPELFAKKKDADGVNKRITVGEGFVGVPARPDGKAPDKSKAFAFNLWTW